VVVIRGDVVRDTTLKRKRTYLLQGTVTVRAGATLRVRPGTTVYCDVGAALVVERGAKLRAEGTADLPIVFTSAQPEAERRRGDWGGIAVNGAPDESSGALRFVRVEYAGYPSGPEGRADALALRGVGAATEVDFVEALNGDGAGVAVLGGTVNLRHVAAVGNSREGISLGPGWSGDAQFLLVQQRGDVAASSYAAIRAAATSARVSNATIVGGGTGLRLGDGASGAYRNLVVVGCDGPGLDVRDAATLAGLARGDLDVAGAIVFANGGQNIAPEVRDALAAGAALEADPLLLNAHDEAAPDFRPREASPALGAENVAAQPSDAFFVATAYAGAFGDEQAGNWLAAWTNFETAPVPRYLANAASSPEALARSFLDALAAGDVVAMKRLRITKKEFCWYVWPELPASQLPNVDCDFVWSQATLNSLAGLDEVLHAYAGRRLELVSLRFAAGDEAHASYVVHGDTRVTLRDEAGEVRELKLFGSMLELDGRYKLFSFVVD
jgi:hypothetical protein